jgi:hypothetical protein
VDVNQKTGEEQCHEKRESKKEKSGSAHFKPKYSFDRGAVNLNRNSNNDKKVQHKTSLRGSMSEIRFCAHILKSDSLDLFKKNSEEDNLQRSYFSKVKNDTVITNGMNHEVRRGNSIYGVKSISERSSFSSVNQMRNRFDLNFLDMEPEDQQKCMKTVGLMT